MANRSKQVLAALAGLALLAGGALGQNDPRIDRRTGADTRVWSPARHFDVQHMKLDITIPDMDEAKFRAIQTLDVVAVGKARDELRLDCRGPVINSVRSGGKSLAFTQEGAELLIRFADAVPAGQRVSLVIDYDLDYRRSTPFTGLFWSAGRPDDANVNNHWPQMHTQGQPQSNSRWFPCHDFPNDRLSTEIVVDVETGYTVISNGQLLSGGGSGPDAAGDGRARWHWKQQGSHAAYLVTLVVGKFEMVDLGGPDSARPGLPIRVWGSLGKAKELRAVFADTPQMITSFERILDEPYPWEKYDSVAARNYVGGAMENTSASTFFGTIHDAPPSTQQGIIAHELIHQWLGDLVTCRSWAHIWLNEGWASMGQALWEEEAARLKGGDSREAYLGAIAGFMSQQRANRGTAPRQPALVSNMYDDPFEVFMKQDNPYPKGALVLHMLREMLGDKTFFAGVHLYIDRFKYDVAETDDFRRCLEEVSGRNLEQFFDQWCFRPGMPQLTIDVDWDASQGALLVSVEQTQTINASNPSYVFDLPIEIERADGLRARESIRVDAKQVVARFVVSEQPKDVVVNPGLQVACRPRIRKDLAMWQRQLEHGPTPMARIEAIEHLAALAMAPEATAETTAMLNAIARLQHDPRVHASVRAAAIEAGMTGSVATQR